MNFRTRLKHWNKDIARSGDKEAGFKVLKTILRFQGLELEYASDLEYILRIHAAKAKGRHFTRIGRAALKQGKRVFIKDIAEYIQHGTDPRTIPFYPISQFDLNPLKWSSSEVQHQQDRVKSSVPFYFPIGKKHESSKSKKTEVETV